MASPIVISASQDHQQIASELINQAKFLIDAAQPAAGQVFPQRFGFTDAIEGIAQASLDPLVDAPALAVPAVPTARRGRD